MYCKYINNNSLWYYIGAPWPMDIQGLGEMAPIIIRWWVLAAALQRVLGFLAPSPNLSLRVADGADRRILCF